MKKFSIWLEEKDPEVYNELLGTLALATGAGMMVAPKTTKKILGSVGQAALNTGANVAGHLANTAIDLGASAIRAGGRGLVKGAKLAGKGAYHGIKSAISKKEDSK